MQLGDTTTLTAGDNIVTTQSGANTTIALNPVLTGLTSIAVGGTAITGTGITTNGGAGPSLTTSGISAAGTTITDVAGGTVLAGSTDAVNGSQLYATNQQIATGGTNLTALGNSVANNLGGGSTYTAATGVSAPSYTIQGSNYNDVGSALGAVNTTLTTNTTNIATNTTNIAKGFNVTTAHTGSGVANTTTIANVQLGDTTTLTAGDNIVTTQSGANTTIALNPVLTGLTSIAVGGTAITGTGITTNSGAGPSLTTSGINAAGKNITNVANGIAATDAATVGQLNAISTSVANAVQYDSASKSSITLGGASGTTITNVAAGTVSAGSTDAVNGSQLNATNNQVATNTASINTLGTNVSNLSTAVTGFANGTSGLVQQAGGAPGNGAITVGAATGGTSIDISGADGNRVISGVAAGVAGTDAVNVNQLAAAIITASGNGVLYDDASRSSLTLNAGGAAAAVHNVAAGAVSAASSDAVNGSQLYASNQQITALNSGSAGPFRSNNTSNAAAPAATGADAVAGGFGAAASGARATAIGGNASATGTNSVALGYGSSDNGLANVVSVGSVGGERQITNVAAGTRATDAANVGQLNAGLASTLSAANGYTDSRLAAIDYNLERARREADSGTASAMAMASLPQAYEAGRGMIAGGFSAYGSQTAFAFGASKAFNDGHTIVKGAGTIGTRGGTAGASVGVGYQF